MSATIGNARQGAGSRGKPLARAAGLVFSTLLVLAGVAIWNSAFRAPAVELLPLPEGLIAVESDTGKELLAEGRFVADYEQLTRHFESQSRRAFCGVASSVVALNALRPAQPRLAQSSFFTDAASQVRSSLRVTFTGMSLDQLGGLLHAHGAEVTVVHAADTDLAAFRSLARENLRTPDDLLLVNYQRAVLGQNEMGHISPIAAYNATTDRLLILDVAAYKYPPAWVATETLWRAMNTTDSASRQTRGFVTVRAGTAAGT